MTYPALTATYAGVLALIYFALSIWVIVGRGTYRVLHGDGGIDRFNRRIRAHGNFAEYVPLIIVLVALLEGGGASATTVHALLLPLVVARIIHPFGMLAPEGSLQQYAMRAPGATVTLIVMVAAAVKLLGRAM